MTSGGVRSKTLGKDLTIVFGGFFFPLKEFMDYANEQSKKINKAYDVIKKSRH
jgi:hypothetical protein